MSVEIDAHLVKAADTHHVYSSHKRLSLKQKRLAQLAYKMLQEQRALKAKKASFT